MLCSENVLQEHHTKNSKESKNLIENEKGWKKKQRQTRTLSLSWSQLATKLVANGVLAIKNKSW